MPFQASVRSHFGPQGKRNQGQLLGSSASLPAASGQALVTARPGISSGFYWIKSASMPNALQMYVDTVEDGGGYDFYFITGGPSVRRFDVTNGGTSLGLDIVYPRSKFHWRAMYNAVANARPSGSVQDYFLTTYGVYGTSAGNYTSVIMRDPNFYGSGSSNHRVKDGGRWWLRDSTFGEPNGDYTAGEFFGGYSIPEPYTLQDIQFNDLTVGYLTGNFYLVSTNAKA